MSLPSQTPADPAAPTAIFTDDEETESFYVILDLSGDDFAAYGRYRNGHALRSRHDSDDSTSSSSQPPSDEEDEQDDLDTGDKIPDEEELEDDEASDGGNDSSSGDSARSSSVGSDARETALQILDLDTYRPLVNYQGKIYRCRWSTVTGTELIFDSPDPPSAVTATTAGNQDTLDDLDEGEEKGRKLRQQPEARLLGTAVHRLEGYPGKLRLRGRDKQEVSTKARMFAERLDAVIEHRVAEMAERGEDVSDITMRKFSEGQQQRESSAFNFAGM
ncbi:hypothetical protein TWF696_000863 [Orbilia brochopaga]|uniref:Transcription factor TFIIIC triple barrel domain-containing protein n=1 Tax=Orbilia brochopaga TaxID=3140254 RepID=A0AAV9VFL4_9PEZI